MADQYVTIEGRSRATAEALLAAAEKVGALPWEVRTTIRGYVVPKAVAAEYNSMLAGDTEPIAIEEVEGTPVESSEEGTEVGPPDSTWKNDQIKEWAEAHQVDLGGATKKADMLAAIQAADTEEG